jgi:nucleoside phosphorylase
MGPRPYDKIGRPFDYEKEQYDLYWSLAERAARGQLEFTLIASIPSIVEDLRSCKSPAFLRNVDENIQRMFDLCGTAGSQLRVCWHEGLSPPAFLVADSSALVWWKAGNGDSIWTAHQSKKLAQALASGSAGAYALVAALDDEFRALHEALPAPWERLEAGPFRAVKSLLECNDGKQVEILVFLQSVLGRAHAAAMLTFILMTFSVDLIVAAGLCGSLRSRNRATGSEVKLGDVIYASAVVDAGVRKLQPIRLETSGKAWWADEKLVTIAKNLRTQVECRNLVSIDDRTNIWFRSSSCLMHEGAFVSIDTVVADGAVNRKLGSLVSSGISAPALAVEMESTGLIAAASIFNASNAVFMIRGVSDFADERKNDDMRDLACRNSAFMALEFIRIHYSR